MRGGTACCRYHRAWQRPKAPDSFQTGLEARQNIRAQIIADDNRLFRMRLHFIQRGADDPRAWFTDIERLTPGDFLDAGAQRAAGRIVAAAVRIRVSGDKARAVGDKNAALCIISQLKERVSPTITKSGLTSVMVKPALYSS